MARGSAQPTSPISLAVFSVLIGVLLVALFAGAIGLNYFLMVHYIHTLQAEQMRQGIPLCHTLKSLAMNGNDTKDMTRLYLTSGCVRITGPL